MCYNKKYVAVSVKINTGRREKVKSFGYPGQGEKMPFIDSKISMKLSDVQKEELKAELGKAIAVMGKSENYLMVGILDGYDLYMAGKKLDKGAFISVQVLGEVNQAQSEKMTSEICRIVSEKLGIPGNNVYVNYLGYRDWGWNGGNF